MACQTPKLFRGGRRMRMRMSKNVTQRRRMRMRMRMRMSIKMNCKVGQTPKMQRRRG